MIDQERASERAMRLSEAAYKAWEKRQRVTYHDLLKKYQQRLATAERKLDKAGLKLTRTAAYYGRCREAKQAAARRVQEIHEAIGQGKLYPDPKEKKKKPGRRIDLD